MGKVFYRANEFKDSLLGFKDKAFERGYLTGFKTLDEYMSFKVGFTTYLYAYPHVGKTIFMNDILIHMAKRYGIKMCVYSPEAGKKEYLTLTMMQTYIAKKMHGENKQIITDEEWVSARDFIDAHFVILDPPKRSKRKKFNDLDFMRFSFDAAFNEVHKAQKEYGWNIEMLVVDPFNHMERKQEDDRMQTQDFVLNTLLFVNEASEEMGLHTTIVNHLRDTERITDKDTGIEYYPKPFPSENRGGTSWWQAGYQMAGLFRCPSGVIEKATGVPYPDDCTDVLVQKSKPFGAGKLGSVRLFFDDSKQRLYEVIDGHKFYAGEYELAFGDVPEEMKPKSAIQPSSSWYEVDKEPELFNDDNEPF